jgi:hypothetical protein
MRRKARGTDAHNPSDPQKSGQPVPLAFTSWDPPDPPHILTFLRTLEYLSSTPAPPQSETAPLRSNSRAQVLQTTAEFLRLLFAVGIALGPRHLLGRFVNARLKLLLHAHAVQSLALTKSCLC